MGGTLGKSGSWVVDHTMDDIPLTPFGRDKISHGSIVTGFENTSPPPYEEVQTFAETPAEHKGRIRSHRIMYTTVFIMSIGFSIVLTSVWPYLEYLNKDLKTNALGFVVAANPLGQMLASPLLGIWFNKSGKIRLTCLITVVFFILGNAFYSLLALFEPLGPMATYYAMIIARFIVGVSSANVTLCRSYLAQSTTLKERNAGIASIAAAQALGFVIGPTIQTVLIVLVPVEVETNIWWLRWNEFTAAGWTAALLGFINLAVLMPFCFKEYDVAVKERALMEKNWNKNEAFTLPKPDILGLTGLLFGFFITLFIYVLVETLAVPFVSEQYAWSGNIPQLVVGVALMVLGILSIGIFAITGKLTKIFDERKVMLFCGYIPILIGIALFLPYPGHSIPRQTCTSSTDLPSPSTTWESSIWTTPNTSLEVTSSSDLLYEEDLTESEYSLIAQHLLLLSETVDLDENCTAGCPVDKKWCEYVPQLPLPQMAVAFFIVMIGYPVAISIAQALFSKMLGPRPQGLWMGILTGVGSLARIAGPIFVSYIYSELGTYWCFGALLVMMVIAFGELGLLYRRLVAVKIPTQETQYAYDGPAAEHQANGIK